MSPNGSEDPSAGAADPAGAHARSIPVTTHGHYLERVPSGGGPHPLLVGFHGYGETAAVHLRELAAVPGSESWLLVAVQGLHAFYRSRTGEVVASWMTRFGRELAIADNIAYVAAVTEDVKSRHPVSGTVVYAGFSQGVAMAFRAAAAAASADGGTSAPAPAAGLIALGGDVPPDVGSGDFSSFPPVLYGRGRTDRGYPEAQHSKDLALLRGKGVEVEAAAFTGGHEWTADFRARAGAFLRRLR